MIDLGTIAADILVGAVLLGLWLGEHLAVAIPGVAVLGIAFGVAIGRAGAR